MQTLYDKEQIEAGYFLSRLGTDEPPAVLVTASWKEAYGKFYAALGMGRTTEEFKNSLKNRRDHFDSHMPNHRAGWQELDGTPQPLSGPLQEVYDELNTLSDEELWLRIKPYAVTVYDAKLSQKQGKATGAKFFSSEFQGSKTPGGKVPEEIVVTHGAVVDGLKLYVEQQNQGLLVYNTQKIDLAVDDDNVRKCIYEVKTRTDTQSVYTAVGQLFMHSAGANNIQKWIVLPGPIDNNVLIECLAALGVSILAYSEQNGTYLFAPFSTSGYAP